LFRSRNILSDSRFNPENDASKRKHNVVLKDTNRQLLLLGLEDIKPRKWFRRDFNDGIFYSTITPFTAVKTDRLKSIATQPMQMQMV
jgi:hypothetical protein